MQSYTVRNATVRGAGRELLDLPAWKSADVAHVGTYPWYKSGQKQDTSVAILNDGEALHILFTATDAHSSAEPRVLNGDVCRDSCVEFFASPFPGELSYFNLEINCCGALHLGWGESIRARSLVDQQTARCIAVVTDFDGMVKDESSEDRQWRVYARLPLAVIGRMAGRPISTAHAWRANFYRCGGKTDPQYACWNPVAFERPNFHTPESFGTLAFA